MPVPKHQVIVMLLFQYVFTIGDQPLPFFSIKFFIGRTGYRTASATKVIGQSHSYIWWQNTKEPLAYGTAKYLLHHLITMIARPQSIAMSYPEFFIIEFEGLGFKVYRNIQFLLKIILHPHIVIAYKEMDRNS